MRVCAETAARIYTIFVDDAKATPLHVLGSSADTISYFKKAL
jgi:hypothetical protein